MKRLLLIASLLFLFVGEASAQFTMGLTIGGGGGGGISSGGSVSGCTSSILYANASSLLGCDPAAVQNGSVSTAGRSILQIKDTITGASATSNFLNITGTFPATLSAATNGVVFSFTGDNDVQTQTALQVTLAGPSNAANSYAGYFETTNITSGGYSYALYGTATNLGTNNGVGVRGVGMLAGGVRTIGLWGDGNASSSGTNSYGVVAYSGAATNKVGGLFILGSSTDPPTGYNSALTADNGVVAANIFEARDNGTAVFTVADGGNITLTGTITQSTASINNVLTTGKTTFGGGGGNATIEPNSANTIRIFRGSSSSEGCLGYSPTSADTASDAFLCSEAAAIFQLGRDINGAATAQTFKAADGITGTDVAGSNMILAAGRGTGAGVGGNLALQTSPTLATGTTAQTLVNRELIVAKPFIYADNTIITFAVVTMGNDTYAGGSIDYCVVAADATTAGSECGRADFSVVDVTAGAGGEVCTFTKVGTPAQALSGSTLAVTLTGTAGTDLCNLRVTADTNIASPTTLKMTYRIINNSQQVITPQ